MEYTIQSAAKIAGVSVRTLHYYDAIGLLQPAHTNKNGYRMYGKNELLKLQQILFFRELGFPLRDIARIIKAPDYDQLDALQEQCKLLDQKITQLTDMRHTIESTILTMKGGVDMNIDDMFKSFHDEKLSQYLKEAKERWGNTDAYKQSMNKVKHWTKKDYDRIKVEGKKFTKVLAEAMDSDIKSPEVQALIAQHHEGIEYFYTCSTSMYRGLADMYVNDPRFRKYYDDVKPGLAKWLQSAIHYYCDCKEDTA